MSDKITGCVVQFEASLPEEEKKLLIEAVQRFSGIESISLQYDVLPAPEPEPPEPNPPKLKSPIPPPGPLPPDEHRRVPRPSQETPDRVHKERGKSGAIQTESDYLQQRHLIDFAIKWGITAKKVNWESIQSLSPEQIVTKAFDLIKQMPEQEIKKIEAFMGEKSS